MAGSLTARRPRPARFRVILVAFWIGTGCGPRAAVVRYDPQQAGRPLRVLCGDAGMCRLLGRTLAAPPPLVWPQGSRKAAVEAGCHRFDVAAGRGGDRAGAVAAGHWVAAWERELREPDSAANWLLQPVLGSDAVRLGGAEHVLGLSAEAVGVVVCFDRRTPDWSARLRHPALSPTDRPQAAASGGVFRWTADGSALVRAGVGRRGIGRVLLVEASDPSAPFAPDDVDLAVLYGRAAGELLAGRPPSLRTRRIPAWDRTYAVWLEAGARWTNDPGFRRWVGSALDREAMASYLFGGTAEAAQALGVPGVAPVASASRGRRPFHDASRPELGLSYEGDDPSAASIARRIKAVLDPQGVVVRLEPRGAAAERALASREDQLSLVTHRALTADPLLGLIDTLWPLGRRAAPELGRLETASRLADPGQRRELAGAIEATLVDSGRLVPLVRLHAWLATRPELGRVETGSYGVLHLDRARWRR